MAVAGYVYAYSYYFPNKYRSAVNEAKYDDKNLIYAVIMAESGFNETALSAKGAVGLMQIKPETAEFMRVVYSLPAGDLLSGEYNVLVGGAYLKYLSGKFSDFSAVIAAYNAGEGRVSAWLKDEKFSPDGETLSSVPFAETAAYLSRVKKFYKFYKFLSKNT